MDWLPWVQAPSLPGLGSLDYSGVPSWMLNISVPGVIWAATSAPHAVAGVSTFHKKTLILNITLEMSSWSHFQLEPQDIWVRLQVDRFCSQYAVESYNRLS